jgi:formylmethanofuran dehydrogenase subunit E
MACGLEKEHIEKAIAFHGHWCPGLAIGIRASELAFKRLGLPQAAELVCVVETDMCGVDAIQVLTGCTFGKGDLMHRDCGKLAFSFFDRKAKKGFRAVFNPDLEKETAAEMRSLMKKTGSLSEEEHRRAATLRQTLEDSYMQADLAEMFTVTDLPEPGPRPARVLSSFPCEACGEMTMESRTRRFDGRTYCIPCFAMVDQKI